jgi:excisionase family DNA binding protein
VQSGQTLGSRVNRRHYITIAEAAEYLQISDRTVRRLIRDGEGLLRLIRCGVEGGVGVNRPEASAVEVTTL